MKYELTENFKETTVYSDSEYKKFNLYQIKAIAKFKDIEIGELGGFIEKTENLAQDGNAEVYGDAR